MKKTEALSSELIRRPRARAIRAKCLDCCCDNSAEVRSCPIKHCPLWIYRMGYEVDYNGKRVTAEKKEPAET